MKQFALRRLDVGPDVLSLRLLLESKTHYRRRGSEICFNVHVIKKQSSFQSLPVCLRQVIQRNPSLETFQ